MSNHMPKDQVFWNFLALVVFAVLVGVGFAVLTGGRGLGRWMYHINGFDMVVLSLATFRIIRLVTFDKIFAFVREWFMDKVGDEHKKPAGGFRRLMAEMIECLWCTGLWAALLVSVLYFVNPLGTFFVVILAVAAVGSFLQNLSQMVGRIGAHSA